MSKISFGDFILAEMNKREMSARQFASFIGVSHGTVNRFLDFGKKDVGYPSIDFIEKLAIATDTKLSTIMGLILPQLADRDKDDPDLELLASQLRELTPTERKIVFAAIRGILTYHEREK